MCALCIVVTDASATALCYYLQAAGRAVRRSSLQQRHKLKTNTFLLLLTVLAAAVMCLNLVSLTAVDTGAYT
jgi:hypothetical protein